jgi:hypothetical protein
MEGKVGLKRILKCVQESPIDNYYCTSLIYLGFFKQLSMGEEKHNYKKEHPIRRQGAFELGGGPLVPYHSQWVI